MIPEENKDNIGSTDLSDKKNQDAFWDDIEFNPDFPSIEEIRKTAWAIKTDRYISE